MSKGFEKAQYAWLMDRNHMRTGWGDVEWFSDGIKHYGTFELSEDSSLDLPVEFRINVNEAKWDQPTFLVKLNGVHAARIDVNGWHRFSGERVSRQSTHFQCHERGSDLIQTTVEMDVPPFPALTKGVNVSYEEELQQCFRASVAWLNVDVSGVQWTPLPFEGGK